jgi:hypothetical protein
MGSDELKKNWSQIIPADANPLELPVAILGVR